VRAVAVVPLNVHAGAGGDVDFDRLGIDHGHTDKYIQPGIAFRARGKRELAGTYSARQQVSGVLPERGP
jgi:hypothetical protein